MITDLTNMNSNFTQSGYKGKTELGRDDFLKLMLLQMRNQDPLNPMESAEFSAQLAQFSSLEQLVNLNEAVNTSIDANYYLSQSINNTMAATLIGKEVKLNTSEFDYSGQENQTLGYTLSSQAKSVTINIYDESGVLVKTIENAPAKSGGNKLIWDFTDNNGNKVPSEKYRFEVDAKSFDDKKIYVNSYLLGKIEGVKFTQFGTKLIVGGSEFLLSDILEIFDPTSEG